MFAEGESRSRAAVVLLLAETPFTDESISAVVSLAPPGVVTVDLISSR